MAVSELWLKDRPRNSTGVDIRLRVRERRPKVDGLWWSGSRKLGEGSLMLKPIAITAITLPFLALGVAAAPNHGTREPIRVSLSGAQEDPTVITDARGAAVLQIQGNTVTYRVRYRDLESDIEQAHIHIGAKDTTGGICSIPVHRSGQWSGRHTLLPSRTRGTVRRDQCRRRPGTCSTGSSPRLDWRPDHRLEAGSRLSQHSHRNLTGGRNPW